MLIVDTSGLLAAIDSDQRQHARSRRVLETHEGPFLLSPFALAELDYLLATKVGQSEQLALLEEVGCGAFKLEPFGDSGVKAAVHVLERYPSLISGWPTPPMSSWRIATVQQTYSSSMSVTSGPWSEAPASHSGYCQRICSYVAWAPS